MKRLVPDFAALELTYRCNHQCIFCSCPWESDETYKKDEMNTAEWLHVIDVLCEFGVRSFSLTGGEAILREDLKTIISYLYDRGLPYNMISNGRAIDDDFLDFLAARKGTIGISVPGIDTFQDHTGLDNVRHVLGLFRKTKALGISTSANITVTKKNLPELYRNIALPLLYGADYILLNRFLPGGRGLGNTEFLLSVDELNQMLDVAEEVLEKAGRYGHVGTELPLCAIRDPGKYEHLKIGTNCAAAKDLMIIDPSGYIKVCNHSPQKLCRYDEIDSLAGNEYWNTFRNRQYYPEMCKDCLDREFCDGGCREAAHAYTGSILDPDPLFVPDKS